MNIYNKFLFIIFIILNLNHCNVIKSEAVIVDYNGSQNVNYNKENNNIFNECYIIVTNIYTKYNELLYYNEFRIKYQDLKLFYIFNDENIYIQTTYTIKNDAMHVDNKYYKLKPINC